MLRAASTWLGRFQIGKGPLTRVWADEPQEWPNGTGAKRTVVELAAADAVPEATGRLPGGEVANNQNSLETFRLTEFRGGE